MYSVCLKPNYKLGVGSVFSNKMGHKMLPISWASFIWAVWINRRHLHKSVKSVFLFFFLVIQCCGWDPKTYDTTYTYEIIKFIYVKRDDAGFRRPLNANWNFLPLKVRSHSLIIAFNACLIIDLRLLLIFEWVRVDLGGCLSTRILLMEKHHRQTSLYLKWVTSVKNLHFFLPFMHIAPMHIFIWCSVLWLKWQVLW